MSPKQIRRFSFISLLIVTLSVVTGLVLFALKQNMNLFFTPTQVVHGEAPVHTRIRVGGMVEKGSLVRGENLEVLFKITDFSESLTIRYRGILPDLFREGQGVVAEGRLPANNVFVANEILAKHDENYMPPEVAKSLNTKKMAETTEKMTETTEKMAETTEHSKSKTESKTNEVLRPTP